MVNTAPLLPPHAPAPAPTRSPRPTRHPTPPHRYCTIIPRLGVGQMGGFEFSTGIQSNSSFPEDDAAFLRSLNEP